MSRIQSIRESVNTQLDKWEAAAAALQAQLDLTHSQVHERLEEQKKQFNDALNSFKENIEHVKEISSDKKQRIESQIEEMQVQMVLGKAETKDTFLKQKQDLQNSISKFEDGLDREIESIESKLDEKFSKSANALINTANKFEAELDAAEMQYEIEKEKLSTDFFEKKDAINSRIAEFKSNLEFKRKEAKEKGVALEQEFISGLSRIKNTFSNLIH